MTIEVHAPGGSVVHFPDGTAAATISSVMAQNFGGPSEDGATNSPSMGRGLLKEFAGGISLAGGLVNKGVAALEAAASGGEAASLPASRRGEFDTFGKRYQRFLGYEDKADETFEREHPYAATAANIAGGAVSTGALGMTGIGARALGLTGDSLLGMAKAGTKSGAVIGGLDAELRGNDPVEGALAGGLGGAAGPVVGRGLAEVGAPIARVARGLWKPDAEAGRRVAGALSRDASSGNGGLNAAEMRAAQAAGQPVALMDAGGETTRALARSAANTSPEARGELTRFVQNRFEGQGGRTEQWLNSTFHYPDADATQEALTQVARTVNRPAYAKAYAKGAGGLWSDELSQISQAPVVADAIRKTMVSAKNEAARMRFPAPQNPFRADSEGRIFLGKDSNGRQLTPSLQFWDVVKRNLDKGGRDAQEWARVLRDHLDEHVPEYAGARAGAAKFFGAQDALEAGRNAVNSRMENPQMMRGLAQMSAAERKLFQDGFVDEYVRMVREAPDRRSILNRIANSPAARERLNMALGPQRSRELQSFLHVEDLMDRARNAIMGGPTTARQLTELGLAGGYDIYEGGGVPSADPTVLARAAVLYGALRGSRSLGVRIDDRVAQRVARLLTSQNVDDFSRGIRIIARNNTLFKAIAGGVRGGVQGGDETSQESRQRNRGVVTVD